METCGMCVPDPKYRKYFINEYEFWKVELHSNQFYLGRSVIILKRHLEDMMDLNNNESEELFAIGKKLRDAIAYSFRADMFNYASLGNEMRHVHLHIVPRYAKPVKFDGHTFEDKRWGKNYSGYDKDYRVEDGVSTKIIESIRSTL